MSDFEDKKLAELRESTKDDVEVDLTLFGNKYTLIQVVTLISYIRNAIQNNRECNINVEIGRNVSDRKFEFLVNNQRADNLIPKEKIEIN